MQRSNEEALDLFADLLEPAAEILGDQEVAEVFRANGKPIKAVSIAIKNHKQAVVEILARLDDIPPEEYKVNILTLPVRLLALLNKPEVKELFTSQGQKTDAARSGAATEITGDGVV